MKYGFVFPGGDARIAARFARDAEAAGWDGFFVWEPVWGVDAWVTLAAAAMQTERIRLGTMLSPLSRMRPWKLASESATLDNLSGGRVILSVGLGAVDTGFEAFGEVTDRKKRAELLDEGLDILTGLWQGQPFNYAGRHYQVKETSFMPPPPPVQQPRIPIWVVGAWPHEKSMERALRYDGLLPSVLKADKAGVRRPAQAGLEDLPVIADYVKARRDGRPYDMIIEGQTDGAHPRKARETVRPWAAAGATWWIEALWSAPSLDAVHRRLEQGPPRMDQDDQV